MTTWPLRLVIDDAEARHGSCRLNKDDAVEDEIPEAQSALESDRSGLSFVRGGCHFSSLLRRGRSERDWRDIPAFNVDDRLCHGPLR